MKNILSLILLLFICKSAYTQTYECGWYGNKSVEERNMIFPFNKAKKVVLVSYLGQTDGLLKKGDNRNFNEANGIIKTQEIYLDTIGWSYKVKEEVVLGQKGIDELSEILVNYTLKEHPKGMFLISQKACYEPRNPVLFYDQNDNVICNFEICFECFQTNMYPHWFINNYGQIQECFPRFELLKELFRKNGISYGLSDNCLNDALIEGNYYREHYSFMAGYSLGELPLMIEIDAEKSNKDFVVLRILINDGETKKPLKGASCTEVRLANKGNEQLTIKKLISISDDEGLIFLSRNKKLQLICIDCPGFVPQVYEYDKIVKCPNY